MSLSKAELLTPRIEVIADYPNSPFVVGDILFFEKSDGVFTTYKKEGYKEGVITAMDFANYPHLFRPLPWYEKRDIEDMPEYVKLVPDSISVAKLHGFDCELYYKVYDWRITDKGNLQGKTKDDWFIVTHFTPATIDEYNQYINGKTK